MNDIIYRQAAIDVVEFGITYAKAINKSTGEVKELFGEGNKALNEAVERLKELPPAQPERKKGKWTLLPNGNAICQECKHVQISAWDIDGWDNFCHHCGADMRGEQDDSV